MGLFVLDKFNYVIIRVFYESDVSCFVFYWVWFMGYNVFCCFDGIVSCINIINFNCDMVVCVVFFIVCYVLVVG